MLETLKFMAGVMFWLFIDLILGVLWLAIIGGIISVVFKGFGNNDDK